MAPPVSTVTQKEICQVFGVTRQAIHDWTKAGMPTRRESGSPRYSVSECVQWREASIREEARKQTKPDIDVEQARKMRADADLSELKVQQMRGELIPSVQVEADMERLCAMVRARVLSVRGRWAPKVIRLGTMAEATAVLDALAADVLDALRDGADELDEEPEAVEAA